MAESTFDDLGDELPPGYSIGALRADEIRKLLPSQTTNVRLPPGRDKYDMSTAETTDVITLADGDYVVRQQNFSARTVNGREYRNTYCFVFRFNEAGEIAYLTEHWNTWHAYRELFNQFDVEPANPLP